MASKLRYVREDVVQRGIRGDSEPLSNAIPHGLVWQRRDPRPSAGDIGAIKIVVVGVVS